MVRNRLAYQVSSVMLVVALILPAVSHGQAIGMKRNDVVPPVISHTPQPDFAEGMPIRIQAKVTDNMVVKDVTLFYREVGSREFQRISMHESPGKDIYSVDLPLMAGSLIEYFIQATDQSGNIGPERLVEPYVIRMPSADVAMTDVGQTTGSTFSQKQAGKKNGVSKWVWIGLGVVAAGAVVMSGSSGGGSSSNGGVVDDPGGTGTGTVTITGPAP
jgi:hypothetical protein